MTRLSPLLVTVLTLGLQAAALACPFCKDSIPTSDAQATGGVPSGFNNSIYLMLGGMFCVLGMIAFTLVKGARSSAGVRPSEPRRGFPLP
jgi:hypothetical protein